MLKLCKPAALAAAIAVSMGTSSVMAAEEVRVYNWSDYIAEDTLAKFTEETGIKVIYDVYDSNEILEAALLSGRSGYDLVVPSNHYVAKQISANAFVALDHSQLPNMSNLNPDLMDDLEKVDPGSQFALPYLWGTTGLAVDTADIEGEPVTAWEDLWEDRFDGRVMLTNDMREVFHVGLRVLGYSGNSTNPDEIEAAYEKLAELMPSVRTFNSDAPRMPYLEGEADVGMIWNGEAVMGKDTMESLEYVYPEEGIIAWLDSFVIPKNAKNPEAAHQFISFVLQPEISALISEEIGYATPNLAARDLLPDEVANNRASYPNATDMINAEFQTDIGDDALQVYAKYWEMLKSGR